MNELRQSSIFQGMVWRLLLLSAIGSIFSDVLLFRVIGFAVTIPHVLLAVTTGMAMFAGRRIEGRIAFFFALIALAEVLHATAVGFVTSVEWQKSFAQFLAYGLCFVVLTRLKPDRETLAGSAPWAIRLGMVVGGLGVLQFILFRMGVAASLPESWRVKSLDVSSLSGRYGGISPAFGLAQEPSYYALGLAALLAYLFFLKRLKLIDSPKLYVLSVVMLVSGVFVSFSLAGIAITSVLVIQQLYASRNLIGILLIAAAILGILWIPASRLGWMAPIPSRVQRIARGLDHSALIRVIAPMRLLFARTGSLETSVFGTGMGMEEREKQIYLSVFETTAQGGIDRGEVEIHNIITIIRFLQGWLGLILYGAMLWIILKPLAGKYQAIAPVLLFFLLYHFSSGLYLSPIFWSSLALVALLRRGTLAAAWSGQNRELP